MGLRDMAERMVTLKRMRELLNVMEFGVLQGKIASRLAHGALEKFKL